MADKKDFSKGNVYKLIVSMAIPLIFAQLVQALYNVVDRIYIGNLPDASGNALTGVGIVFPIIIIITAFTNLFSMGGTPLCAIERGKENSGAAEKIMGNTFSMLIITSAVLMILCYAFLRPMLYLFGASDSTFIYAKDYFLIYLLGTPFAVAGIGMNGFINCQGFPKTSMISTLIGALSNIILDPVFIFGLNMGVKGAALATVISQMLSAMWIMMFLFGKKTLLKINAKKMKIDTKLLGEIMGLGAAGFIMSASTGLVQIVCNATLKGTGGDIYVGIMTVLNSIREVILLPPNGFTNAAQPVIGYNYGAKKYDRVKKSIKFISVCSVLYSAAIWLVLFLFPEFFIKIFNSSGTLLEKGVPALHIYFFGFFVMSLQIAGQSVFVGLGLSKQAVFFSIFRKIIIVLPLTLILPRFLGVMGVFVAEAVSNFVGASACYVAMLITVKKLFMKEKINILNNKTHNR